MNHGITGKGSLKVPWSNSLLKVRLALKFEWFIQGPVQDSFECLQGWIPYRLPEKPYRARTALKVWFPCLPSWGEIEFLRGKSAPDWSFFRKENKRRQTLMWAISTLTFNLCFLPSNMGGALSAQALFCTSPSIHVIYDLQRLQLSYQGLLQQQDIETDLFYSHTCKTCLRSPKQTAADRTEPSFPQLQHSSVTTTERSESKTWKWTDASWSFQIQRNIIFSFLQ